MNNPVNKDALISMMINTYNSEGCGICEKEGAEIFWFNPYSRGAHDNCFKKIEAIESALNYTINILFRDATDYYINNQAHIRAIKAIRTACGNDTILVYLEKNGLGALKNLFDSIGIKAVKEYASEKLPINTKP